MVRWHRALAAGKILQGEYLGRYWDGPGSLLAGGDQFGFEVLYTQGPDTMMVIMSNARGTGGMRRFEDLGRELADLVSGRVGRPAPRFSLGVMLAIDGEGVTVDDLRPGSAAERDGLRPGDRLLSANGKPLGDDPLAALDPFLATGETIRFEIRRGGRSMTVNVKPDPR
jgi:S1-C subfamily serine protease